jgi:transposase, IS30 family
MTYLTYSDRKIIERMLRDGESHRSIGKVLGRGKSTISEEIAKNQMEWEDYYKAESAHARSLRRQENKGKKPKIERNPVLKAHIIAKMKEDQWSPQQIAGEINTRCKMTIISHETIYQFVYSDEGKRLKLWLELRRKKRPYRQPWGKRRQRVTIPERVSIHEREESANKKMDIGHLETDSMQFSKQREILSVQVDRLSLKCVISKLLSKEAEPTKSAIEMAINQMNEAGEGKQVLTITFDNGTENVRHVYLKKKFKIQTYFCDAYSSWQKGLVENINGLIRQYLPLKTNMSQITDEDIQTIQDKLNNRPRKTLGYITPNQAHSILARGGRLYP